MRWVPPAVLGCFPRYGAIFKTCHYWIAESAQSNTRFILILPQKNLSHSTEYKALHFWFKLTKKCKLSYSLAFGQTNSDRFQTHRMISFPPLHRFSINSVIILYNRKHIATPINSRARTIINDSQPTSCISN